MLVPDAAWQSTCASPVVIRCNFTVLTFVVTLLDLRAVLAIVSDNALFWVSFEVHSGVHPS